MLTGGADEELQRRRHASAEHERVGLVISRGISLEHSHVVVMMRGENRRVKRRSWHV